MTDAEPFLPEVSVERRRAARAALAGKVRRTPIVAWPEADAAARFGDGTELVLKLEILQHASNFKTRGALLHLLGLSADERARGVIAASAGNHAVAVAFAARLAGISAKVVVPRTCSPARLDACRSHGAEVIMADDIHGAFAEMERIRAREGRVAIHSFDSPWMLLGAGDLATELYEQAGRLDVVVAAIGGGGLCAGIAAAIAAIDPACSVYGVEPSGADTMFRSRAAGRPLALERRATIADSLAAPGASARTLAICDRFVRDVVLVDDAAILSAVRALFHTMKLAVEPAAAAALAGVFGPLAAHVRGKRVGIVLSGSNIDPATYTDLLR